MADDEVDELLEIAVDLAHRAGDLLARRPPTLATQSKTTPTDAVTEMDRAAEELIVDRLARLRPGDGVLGEEGGARAGGRVTWVVDPLDGTVNYLYDIPQWAVSVAAEIDGASVAGAVFDVSRDRMYTATVGGAAACNGSPLRCTAEDDPAMALVATGFAYAADTRAQQADVVRHVLPRVRDIRRFGSAALDLCAVAAGQVDGYFERGMHRWDWAAGALIARQAGARVEGLHGRPPGNHVTLAANPALFCVLHDLLVDAGAEGAGDPVPPS